MNDVDNSFTRKNSFYIRFDLVGQIGQKPKFIEIGTGDYSESNTRFLFERTNCKGLIVDCIKNLKKKVSRNTKLWKGDLTIVEEFVDSENITKILKDNNFFEEIDLFSLDIYGVDYCVI